MKINIYIRLLCDLLRTKYHFQSLFFFFWVYAWISISKINSSCGKFVIVTNCLYIQCGELIRFRAVQLQYYGLKKVSIILNDFIYFKFNLLDIDLNFLGNHKRLSFIRSEMGRIIFNYMSEGLFLAHWLCCEPYY